MHIDPNSSNRWHFLKWGILPAFSSQTNVILWIKDLAFRDSDHSRSNGFSCFKKAKKQTKNHSSKNGELAISITQQQIEKAINDRCEKVLYVSGQRQEGLFENGNLVRGKVTFLDGAVHEGEFKDNCLHRGRITFPSGQIKDGLYDYGVLIQGKVIFVNGQIKEGKFQDGEIIEGKITSPNGIILEGHFKDELLDGWGKFIGSDGKIQEGEFKCGLLNGKGKMILSNFNKEIREGEFKDGQLHGQGKVTFARKRHIKEGVFREGRFYKSLYPQVNHSKKRLAFPDLILPAYMTAEFFEELLDDLGPSSTGITEDYIEYMRRLVFGFSVGQKIGIKRLYKECDISINDLKQLEGNNFSVNMLYVIHHLEQLINKIKAEGKKIFYLNCLQKIYSDLKRSVPFVFISNLHIYNSANAERTLVPFAKDMWQELNRMQPNERLLVPTGNKLHVTMLVFQKLPGNNILTTHYNTGLGILERIDKKRWSDPVNASLHKYPIHEEFPLFQLDQQQTDFESMMVKILSIQNHRQKESIGQITTFLEEHLGEGVLGPAKHVQVNNVCGSQIIIAVFEDMFPYESIFKAYQYDFLTHLQAEFQEITDDMIELANSEDHLRVYLPIHKMLLAENRKQINSQIMAKL